MLDRHDPDGPIRVNQPLRPPRRPPERPDLTAGPAWPSFTGTAQLVGSSASGVTVYVDPTLGQPGRANAESLLAGADAVVELNNSLFAISGGAVDVIIYALNGQTDGTGGADHGGCDFVTGNAIEVDASFGAPDRITALFEAELSECAMNGRLCGLSTGEALSRWCAAVASNNALSDFATAPQWFADGMPNWVDRTAPTDTDADSTGCGMAFISWLIDNGHKLTAVAQTMVRLGDSGTLSRLYAELSGDVAGNAWSTFAAALEALAGGVTSDDPWEAIGKAL